jgi:hypothetical protein
MRQLLLRLVQQQAAAAAAAWLQQAAALAAAVVGSQRIAWQRGAALYKFAESLSAADPSARVAAASASPPAKAQAVVS